MVPCSKHSITEVNISIKYISKKSNVQQMYHIYCYALRYFCECKHVEKIMEMKAFFLDSFNKKLNTSLENIRGLWQKDLLENINTEKISNIHAFIIPRFLIWTILNLVGRCKPTREQVWTKSCQPFFWDVIFVLFSFFFSFFLALFTQAREIALHWKYKWVETRVYKL